MGRQRGAWKSRTWRVLVLAVALGCGSGKDGPAQPPGVPRGLTVDAGDGAAALGWRAPASDGGAPVGAYDLVVSPAVADGSVQVHGTTALVGNLTNGTPYTFSLSARNRAGAGSPSSAVATPAPYTALAEASVEVQGDSSPSGIYDPSVLLTAGGTAWMAYSSVDYHLDGSLQVQDVGIALARSDDAGATWTRVGAVATPSAATVTDTLPNHPVCGAATCTGRWAYETAWLVEDPGDVAGGRYKLFAHQYFLYPPAAEGQRTVYVLGAIVTWSAATPEDLVSAPPTAALRWNLTPPQLPAGGVNVNGLAPDLAGCLAVAEGGASVRGDTMDLVLACTYAKAGANPLPQKVVLLRSDDHGQQFRYVSTLLDAPDAASLGASFYTAPSLLPRDDAAPVLLVTPAFSGVYGGCVEIPFEDLGGGVLARAAGMPAVILSIPTGAGAFGGACAADRGLAGGILRNEVDRASTWPPTFRIIRTGREP